MVYGGKGPRLTREDAPALRLSDRRSSGSCRSCSAAWWRRQNGFMELTAKLVLRLVAEQFPEWADLPVTPVAKQGNDNRTFRLGDDLAVRLPSHESYVAGITKADTVLPRLADHLSLPIPAPVATGQPTHEYPHRWSARRWLPGETPDADRNLDRARFAHDLGMFLCELRAVPAEDVPAAGVHSFYRGCHSSVYGDQVQQALAELGKTVDARACTSIWHEALRTAWNAEPVWFHGDIGTDNLLTTEGRLSAVIDFGAC